jgi:TolB protein
VASLVLLDQGDTTEVTLHTTQRGFVELVAEGAFHYTQWSPNGRHLSVVAPQEGGGRLAIFDVALDGGEPFEVSANAPLYHAWSPDGTRILIHQREFLLLHDVRTRETIDLGRESARYRVPAFSPDGEEIAFVAGGDGSERLFARNLASGEERPLWTVRTHASFAWSPVDTGLMAAAQRITLGAFRLDGIVLIDTRTGETDSLFNGAVAAFYWSPDGTKIAALVDGPRRNSFAWVVIDVASGEVTNLTPFTSSARYLTSLEFFDQFAPSHSPWSADSTALVVAGGITLRPRGPSQIWVLDASGESAPRAVAEGRLAFWGPPGDR